MLKLSVSTMVYLRLAPSRAVERLFSRGYRAVELSFDNFLLSGVDELSELEKVADIVSGYDTETFSVHLPYDRLEPSERGLARAVSRFAKWMRILDRLKVDYYVTHLPNLPPHGSSIGLATRYLKSLVELPIGGSRVLVENASSRALLGALPEDIAEIVRRVGSPAVGACVDVGHALITRVPLRAFGDILGSLVVSVHVHDNDGFSDRHMLPGTGVLRIEELAEFVARLGAPRMVAEVACGGSVECDSLLNAIRLFERDLKSLSLSRTY